MSSLAEVKDVAAQWIARRDGENWNEADGIEFERWLRASTRNRIAYLRVEAAWREANRLKVLGAGARPGVIPSLEDWRSSPFFRHISRNAGTNLLDVEEEEREATTSKRLGMKSSGIRIAFAASFLFALVSVSAWYFWPAGDRYSTLIGVTTAVPLSDGSKATLNTASEIRVAVTQTERRVELAQGEVFFEVEKDPNRPFIVTVGDKRVIAVGTKFSVRRDANDIRVVVTEGKVRFADVATRAPLDVKGATATPGEVFLTAGSIANTHNGRVTIQERSLPQAEELLSWRNGYVVFHETALTDAVAEFNRYNTRKFVIPDSRLVGIPISGNFRFTSIEPFARLLEQGFPVTVERRDDRIILTQRQSQPSTSKRDEASISL